MIALMEEAACACIAPFLKEGETTVGTSLNISHTSATPGGMHVYAEARRTAVEGRKLSLDVYKRQIYVHLWCKYLGNVNI